MSVLSKTALSFEVPVELSIWLSRVISIPDASFLELSRLYASTGQMRARTQLLRDLRKVVLGNGKQHRDRLELSDHDHAVGIGSMDDVARIHQAQTNHTRNRGRDLRIRQLQLGVIDVGVYPA